jgi:hypothetical protein
MICLALCGSALCLHAIGANVEGKEHSRKNINFNVDMYDVNIWSGLYWLMIL